MNELEKRTVIDSIGKMDLSHAEFIHTFPNGAGVTEVRAMAGKPEACSWIHTKCLMDGGLALLDPDHRCVDTVLNSPNALDDMSRLKWKEQYAVQEKRVTHCLRRLKAKKLIMDTDREVLDFMRRHDMTTNFTSRELTYSGLFVIQTTPIPEDVWKTAIELTMYFGNRPVFLQADVLYASAVEQHLDLLYSIVLLLHATVSGNTLYKRLQSYFYEGGMEAFMNDLSAEASSNAWAVDQLRDCEQKLKHVLAQVLTAQDELSKAQGEIARLQKQLLGRDAKIRALERALRVNEAEDTEDGSDGSEGLQEAAEPIITEAELLDLPERDVWFVGGAEPLRKKLMSIYPEWNYIEAGDDAFAIPQKCSAAFLFYKHISHKIANRVRDNLPRAAKLFYVSTSNVDLLIRDMREQYTAAQNAD